MDEIKQDVKEIKTAVGALVTQGAIHNHLLREHEARSLALAQGLKVQEARVTPLEDDFKFRQKLYVLIMGGSGLLAVAALVVAILK